MPIDGTILNVSAPNSATPGESFLVSVYMENTGDVLAYFSISFGFEWDHQGEIVDSAIKGAHPGGRMLFSVAFTMPNATLRVLPMVNASATQHGPFVITHLFDQVTVNVSMGALRALIDSLNYPNEAEAGHLVEVAVGLKNVGTMAGWLKPVVGWIAGGAEELDDPIAVNYDPGQYLLWRFSHIMPAVSLQVNVYAYHYDIHTGTYVLDQQWPLFTIKLVGSDPPPDGDGWVGPYNILSNRMDEADIRIVNLDLGIDNLVSTLPQRIEAQTNSWWSPIWQTVDAVIRSTAAALTGDINQVRSAQTTLERIWRDLNFSWPNVGAYMLDFLPGARPIVDIWDAINALKGWVDSFDLDIGGLISNPIDWMLDRLWDWLNAEVEEA